MADVMELKTKVNAAREALEQAVAEKRALTVSQKTARDNLRALQQKELKAHTKVVNRLAREIGSLEKLLAVVAATASVEAQAAQQESAE